MLICVTIVTLFTRCNEEKSAQDTFSYILEMTDASSVTEGCKIYYLGVEVGHIGDFKFEKRNNTPVVTTSIILKKENLITDSSFMFINTNGLLELSKNGINGQQVNVGSTIFLKSLNDTPNLEQIDLQKEATSDLSEKELEKLHILESKINNLNKLIQDVNDQN